MSKQPLCSTEIGALWMTYQKKTVILRMLEYFRETAESTRARKLLDNMWKDLYPMVEELKHILQKEGAAVPIGFTEHDVNLNAPPLYINGFGVMFSRVLKEISMGMYTLHVTMTYRDDIIKYYRRLTQITHTYYYEFTTYLLEEGLLPRPTFINLPQSSAYITDKAYLKGTNILGHKRKLNTIEFGYLYHLIETNITGMQLISGFAQCADDSDLKRYFLKGQQLSKKMIAEATALLQAEDIQVPATPGGTVTNSTVSPFSEKLMTYCVYLLSNFGLGGQSFGAAFSLRNDLNATMSFLAKDVFEFARDGIHIMIANGWLEEPPSMDIHHLR
ncbi:DUF3231 family protein [Ectobacillus sp. JY-23]|uniref:DUF3231 family protein n=1 Tax=Ectobacillus sp. JY-23 TaxID=2933872 RepID=UPI001FF0FA36|nr:DUF3231 family protein [Ectobacillus sp. JY-23]UOY93127.1 DUF3231 family protein [Ectobacillus sp. JY-23]